VKKLWCIDRERPLVLTVNRKKFEAQLEPRATLPEVLRNGFSLTAAKNKAIAVPAVVARFC
jgi:aerobic-type carbon monoxide dehydrogenase small subunit (CoxS/CutS family)